MNTIRIAAEADIPLIREMARLIWPATYYPIIGREQVDYMLEWMYSPEALRQQFADGCVFLISEADGLATGFAAYSTEHQATYKLHKLYVFPEKHGQGIGKMLVDEVIRQVKEQGGITLLLNVNKQNPALHFYKRCGFSIKEAVTIDIGNGFVMDDYVMEIMC